MIYNDESKNEQTTIEKETNLKCAVIGMKRGFKSGQTSAVERTQGV